MDEKKLIEAAKLLKEHCANADCDNCRFYDPAPEPCHNSDCILNAMPTDWVTE